MELPSEPTSISLSYDYDVFRIPPLISKGRFVCGSREGIERRRLDLRLQPCCNRVAEV